MKKIVKLAVTAVTLLLALPFAALCGFGRVTIVFKLFAQMFSLGPGIVGDYFRVAYYVMTLESCSVHSRISFGSFFAQRTVRVGKGVYIGAYCVVGTCRIGERTQIASHVQIFGGGRQHRRDETGRILGADERTFTFVEIGSDCWIGASAIIMADIGPGTTIAAGAVVPRPIPAGVTAVGNPARVINTVSA